MSKKTKRQVRREPEAAVLQAALSSPLSTPRALESDFHPDYSQIEKDLKRIGILAGSCFTVLIILAFILK